MTDTGPGTPVDDITVIGQRARGESPFAGLQWPSRGGGSGDQQLELGEDEQGAGTLEPTWVNPEAQPCPGSGGGA